MKRLAPAELVAALGLAFLTLQLLALCGGPLQTADLWWHLKMGEVYAHEGPWPDGDPLLHTAHEDAPVQHEWLFGVSVHLVERALGLHGLRVAHTLALAGILALVWGIFRRESAGVADAAAAGAAFLVLAFPRLMQLRPDLVSIFATFALYRWLFVSREPPGWGRVAACAALLGVWANMHSLFAIGLLLGLATLLGIGLRVALARWAAGRGTPLPVDPAREAALARRIGAALALGLAATLANPRGIGQHLTFFTSSSESALWSVIDEWAAFDFFSPPVALSVSALAWLVAYAVFAAFAVSAAWSFLRCLRWPTARHLQAADPVLLGLASASVVAALTSVRFLWLLAFPLLFLLRTGRLAQRPLAAGTGAWACAAVVWLLALAAPQAYFLKERLAGLPASPGAYLRTAYAAGKFHASGVRFLEETGVRGNLYNPYFMGGFLGYRLAPRLRTFIDSRTEHYGVDVFRDHRQIEFMLGSEPGESFLDVLERRRVDLFFGTGLPGQDYYTSAHLERAPGWTLVWRTPRSAIYLRRNARNAENAERIAAWYEREGVPFDAQRGLDVGAVLRARPGWAEARGMAPPGYVRALERSRSRDPDERARGLAAVGAVYARAGAYEAGVEAERESLGLEPDAAASRRRLVYDLLRLDRPAEALAEARALRARERAEGRRVRTFQVARRYAQRRGEPVGGEQAPTENLINLIELD